MPFHPTSLQATLFLAALLVVSATSSDGLGCAVAPPKGVRVDIAQESAILIWDPANKMQHFIRRASFSRGAGVRDFGFIVPTPSYPDLAEANDEAFKILERATAPKKVNKTRPINLTPFGCAMSERAAPKAAGVEVLQELRIAGYDAVVLEAKDTDALGTWLKKHGYDFPDSMKAWADGYLRQGWKFTAFKVGQDAKGQQLTTSPVRMSFSADRPFFPYREPTEEASDHHRLLRVYFVADARYRGTLKGTPWPGIVAWSNHLGDERNRVLKEVGLPADTGPQEWRLTEFEDRSSPRPGQEDVTFEPDPTQATVERPKTIVWTEPGMLDLFLAGAWCWGPFVLVVLVWWWRRARRPVSPT